MKRAEPGWLVLALAGIAALIGSFLPFYTYASSVDVTVWSRGLFPTATLIPILGFFLAIEAGFVLLMGYEPRSPFFNFTWEQVRLGTGAFMILLALSFLVQDRAGGSLGSGYVILSLAALMTFTGGIMTRRAQIVRAPAEKPSARAPSLKPVLTTLRRWGGELTGNAAALGRNAKAHLGLGEANESTTEAEEPGRVATLSPVKSESEPAAEAKPADTSPDGDAKPADTKADEPKPADTQTADTQTADTKTADTKTADTKTAEAKKADAKPTKATAKKTPSKKAAASKPKAETETGGDAGAESGAEQDEQDEQDEESERPAAPG